MFLVRVDKSTDQLAKRSVRLPHQCVQQQLHLTINLCLVPDPRHISSVQYFPALQSIEKVIRVHISNQLVPVSGELLFVFGRHQLIVCPTTHKFLQLDCQHKLLGIHEGG